MIRLLVPALFFAAITAGRSVGGFTLVSAAEEAAEKVKKVAGNDKVRVGHFIVQPADVGEHTGFAIRDTLVEKIGAARFDSKGNIQVEGEYQLNRPMNAPPVMTIEIKVSFVSPKRVLTTFSVEVKDWKDIRTIFPAVGAMPPPPPTDVAVLRGEAQNERDATAYVKLLDAPTGTIPPTAPTLVRPSGTSPFAVEVLSRPRDESTQPYKPLPVSLRDLVPGAGGNPHVPIPKGHVFALRISNSGPDETLVGLKLDGLDQFAFSEFRTDDGLPRASGWVLPAKGSRPGELSINGWHKNFADNTHEYYEFLVTDYAKGAVRLRDAPQTSLGKVGLIALTFAKSYPAGAIRGNPIAPIAIGLGPVGRQAGRVEPRVSDPPSEFLTIRYDR